MKKLRRFLEIIAFVLVVSLCISSKSFQIVSSAVGEDIRDSKLYISEVKMFYGRDENDVRTFCEKDGYILCPMDLNEGAAGWNTYIGYKTTENPKDAITDLTLLDMKYTHYNKIDYQAFLDEHIEDFRNQAAQMMVLVNELAKKLEAGSPNALMAYDSLNLMYVDKNKPHDAQDNQLGYYLINYADITFFEKFIQRGSAIMLNKIISLLCTASSDYEKDGTTWIDKAKVSEVAIEYANAASDKKNWYDEKCQDTAKTFVEAIRSFSDTYNEAKQLYDAHGETFGYAELEGMTEENIMEKLRAAGTSCRYPEYVNAMKTYTLLDNITYQTAGETVLSNAALLVDNEPEKAAGEDATEGTDENTNEETQQAEVKPQTFTTNLTLAQYIMDLAKDDTLDDHLSTVYPIVMSLSQAQCVTLKLGGFSKLIDGLYQSNDYPAKRTEVINDTIKQIKDAGMSDGRMYVWTGMDATLYDKLVVQTDARKEAAAAGIELQNAEEEAQRKEQDTLAMTLNIIDLTTLAFSGVMMIINAVVGSLWTIAMNVFTCASVNIAAGAVGTAITGYVIGTLFCALHVLNILCMVVGFVLFIYNIFKGIGMFDAKPQFADFTGIPDVVFDARQSETGTYSVRYNSLRSNYKEYRAIEKQREEAEGYYTGDDIAKGMSDDHAELSGFHPMIERWMAMYYTKSPAAGDPIEISNGMLPLVTRVDNQAPDGYRPLTLITSSAPVNVNDPEAGGSKNKPLYAFIAGKNKGKAAGGVLDDDGSYVTKVRFSYDTDQQNAINRLKKLDYQYFDVNLSPGNGYTYLGYQLGSEANALTDIRISNSNASSIAFGDASYGRMGMDGKDSTPYGMTLFATSSKAAGSPIVGISIENKRKELGSGFEPVCLFSGGNAVEIGYEWRDNVLGSGTESNEKFFLKNGNNGFGNYYDMFIDHSYDFVHQDDPVNGTYIYFQPKEQFKSTDANGNPAQCYISGFSYFLAGDKETKDNRFGTNYEYMQTFAKENGFELLKDKNGEAFRVMSDEAGEMTIATTWREVWGYPVSTYKFDQIHTVHNNIVLADGSNGLSHRGGFADLPRYVFYWYTRESEKMIHHTAMYFGVAYTYNLYRAITGISGLITPYTEKNDQIKFTGMKTPAGTFQACNVSIQGCPINSAGITAGYYNPLTMTFPLYTNYEAKQHSDLSWTTDKDMEVLSHYLMTSGPRSGVLPLKEDDIAFSMQENPGQMSGFVPLCDLRTPGDYDHPMNLALDTTNKGSKYLYLYLKAGAGGREENDLAVPQTNVYTKKKYVAAVFCGVGKTPEAAISNLYSNAADMWPKLASTYKDISARPLVTEFDEIIPIDISSEHPWYTLQCSDTNVDSLKKGVGVRGNEMAYYRWEGYGWEEEKSIDEYEKDWKCAYIGVVRIAESTNKASAAYGMLKYYTSSDKVPGKLNCDGTECICAGGPVNSKEGKYYIYYSTNSGTASYAAPITSINISDEIFTNGYNTAFTVSESDRKDNKLPAFSELRMRTDEHKYIHMGYAREDLPYYEALYIGVGDTKADAFVDMVGTTNAYAAIDVNCNYNSYSKKWIAIGYRRTKVKKDAICDVFLYQGDDPPDKIYIKGAYELTTSGTGRKKTKSITENTDGILYKLVKHNLKSGAEIMSLNEGNGKRTGLYLYYTTKSFYRDKSNESEVTPITNIFFTYGDISPRKATAQDLSNAFERSYYVSTSSYTNPVWECVLGVSGSPENWTPTGKGATRFSLNQGILPDLDGNIWNGSDNRVFMYVDRADSGTSYKVRESAKLPEFGYYSAESTFGIIRQVG